MSEATAKSENYLFLLLFLLFLFFLLLGMNRTRTMLIPCAACTGASRIVHDDLNFDTVYGMLRQICFHVQIGSSVPHIVSEAGKDLWLVSQR